MTKLRTLVIGFGKVASGMVADAKMARYFDYASHASVLNTHPEFDWLGVVDPNPAAQEDARSKWRVVHVGADVSEIANMVRPEVVVLATPPGHRAKIVAKLPTVKAILVEKPLNAPSDDDGSALAEICAARGIKVLVNYWRRADRLFQSLSAGGLQQKIGDVQTVFGLYGNGLSNNGSHMIDFLRLLAGDIVGVQALSSPTSASASSVAGDVSLSFALTLKSGAVASFSPVEFETYREVGLDIWGTRGRLSILQEGLTTRLFSCCENRGLTDAREIDSDQGTILECTVGDSLYRMYDNLAAVARGVGDPWSSLHSALVTETIMSRILQSAEQGGARLPLD